MGILKGYYFKSDFAFEILIRRLTAASLSISEDFLASK